MESILTIKSPCVQICKIEEIDGVDTCTGCQRTLEQIKNWKSYTDHQRDEIIDDLPPNAYNSTISTSRNMHLGRLIYSLSFRGMELDVPISYGEEDTPAEDKKIDRGFARMQNWSRVFTTLKYL